MSLSSLIEPMMKHFVSIAEPFNLGSRNVASRACVARKSLQPVCVCLCVLFFQSVIVIPLAQSVIAVMTQDFVYVRRALRGPSVRSVCPAICGTMAANVSRTTNVSLRLSSPLFSACLTSISVSLASCLSLLIPRLSLCDS